MIPLPIPLIVSFLLGFISVAVPLLALSLLRPALRRRLPALPDPRLADIAAVRRMRPRLLPVQKLLLALALLMLLWTFAGRYAVLMMRPVGVDDPTDERSTPGRMLKSSTGAMLHVEEYGARTAPTIVFSHGWGADSREWYYARRLADDFHVVLWDLPGLGLSTPYPDEDYSLQRMAEDLQSVIAATSDGPTLIAGHSIGGMINLTYARLHPEELGKRVRGILQLNTTYTNPVHTTRHSERAEQLQKPVLEPALQATIWLSPLVRAVGWLNYMNGLAHIHLHAESFAGAETRGQLDFAARYAYRSSPAVVSRGALAMLHWDATDVMPHVNVPVLVVSGDQDTTTLPEASETMERSLPNAQRRQMQLAAHLGPIEQHGTYEASMREFAFKVLAGEPPATALALQ